jgi:hypothetical protein
MKSPKLDELSASPERMPMIPSSASSIPIGPAARSTKPRSLLSTRPVLTPSGDLQVHNHPARNLQVNTRLKQNVEAWEAVSSDIQRALKLHFVDSSQSYMRSPNFALKESDLHFPDANSRSTITVKKLQNSGTEAPQPLLTAALATKPHMMTTDPVRKASTVLSGKLEGRLLPSAVNGTADAGERADLAGLAVLNGIEQEAAGMEQREQEDTLRLSQDSLSSLALLRTESAVQARLSLLQRSLAANIVREQAPLLRALRANSATADVLLHRAPARGTGGGQLGEQAAAAGPTTRPPASTGRSESAGYGRAPSSAGAARRVALASVGQTQLAAMRHEVAAMEQLAATAAAKSEAAAGQGQRRGVLEAAYRVGCRAYMLRKDC